MCGEAFKKLTRPERRQLNARNGYRAVPDNSHSEARMMEETHPAS
jgi:hypothetical protein